MTPDVRHQVFVSSTYLDLVEERRSVMQALLELDCMPAGMELFPAADEDSWSLIRRVIDESDYYIVIVGGRYGSVHEVTGVSYTRMEYEYALSLGKPILGFLHSDPDSLPLGRSEKSEAARRALDEFRDLVAQKQCRFWSSPEELGGLVSRSLIRLRRTRPSPGWVRADRQGDIHLRERILQLETELSAARSGTSRTALLEHQFLEDGDVEITVEIEVSAGIRAVTTTWNHLFLLLIPITLDPADQQQISTALAEALRDDRDESSSPWLTNESFTRIVVFLVAASLLERHGYEYRLTEKGVGVAANLQRRASAQVVMRSTAE